MPKAQHLSADSAPAPLHETKLSRPSRVRLYLMVDAGGPAYEQVEFEISDQSHPWLKAARRLHLVMEVTEDGGKLNSCYLRPDTRRSRPACKTSSRASGTSAPTPRR